MVTLFFWSSSSLSLSRERVVIVGFIVIVEIGMHFLS